MSSGRKIIMIIVICSIVGVSYYIFLNVFQKKIVFSSEINTDSIHDFVVNKGFMSSSNDKLKPVDIIELQCKEKNNEFEIRLKTSNTIPDIPDFTSFEAYVIKLSLMFDNDENKIIFCTIVVIDDGWGYTIYDATTSKQYFRIDAEHWKNSLWNDRLPVEYSKNHNIISFLISRSYPLYSNSKTLGIKLLSGYEDSARLYDYIPNEDSKSDYLIYEIN